MLNSLLLKDADSYLICCPFKVLGRNLTPKIMFKHIKVQGKDRMIDERFPKAAYQKNIPLWTL
jgi:hypothetical protein